MSLRNWLLLLLLALCQLVGGAVSAQEVRYRLLSTSEEYNTRYFYEDGIPPAGNRRGVHYIDRTFPTAFVMELGALKEGEKAVVVYNDDLELAIARKKGRYTVNKNVACGSVGKHDKVSLYFVNGLLLFYVDDHECMTMRLPLDRKKRIGVRRKKRKGYAYPYLKCYEPVALQQADYGSELEQDGKATTKKSRASLHNVGQGYCLTFPTDRTAHSKSSMRFEHRYEDRSVEGASDMKRVRSEVSGVYALSPMNKWVIEFDFMVPGETPDDANVDIVTQVHENSADPSSPSFCLFMKEGVLCCSVRGDSVAIGQWKRQNKPTYKDSKQLVRLEKDRWYHLKVYLKEGKECADRPVTKIWVDGELLYESHLPNCYQYKSIKGGTHNYLKFGIYRPKWTVADKGKNPSPRVYYFDNYVVKY